MQTQSYSPCLTGTWILQLVHCFAFIIEAFHDWSVSLFSLSEMENVFSLVGHSENCVPRIYLHLEFRVPKFVHCMIVFVSFIAGQLFYKFQNMFSFAFSQIPKWIKWGEQFFYQWISIVHSWNIADLYTYFDYILRICDFFPRMFPVYTIHNRTVRWMHRRTSRWTRQEIVRESGCIICFTQSMGDLVPERILFWNWYWNGLIIR